MELWQRFGKGEPEGRGAENMPPTPSRLVQSPDLTIVVSNSHDYYIVRQHYRESSNTKASKRNAYGSQAVSAVCSKLCVMKRTSTPRSHANQVRTENPEEVR